MIYEITVKNKKGHVVTKATGISYPEAKRLERLYTKTLLVGNPGYSSKIRRLSL